MVLQRSMRFSVNWILTGLLGCSLLIRMILIFSSGELVHQDGPEYLGFSSTVYTYFSHLDWKAAFTTPVVAHWGCILLGTIPHFLKPAWLSQQEASAIFFSLPSVINIYLLYRIVLKFGGQNRIALISALLYTLSFSSLYHTRHVHPHDLAIMFFLLGTFFTLKNANRQGYIPLIGFCHFLCFFTYYGYWTLAFVGMLFVSLHKTRNMMQFIFKGVAASGGFLAPLMLFLGIGYYYEVSYFDHFFVLSKTINMGSFDEGYAVPFLFLWHAEGLLFLLWLICLPLALGQLDQYPVKCCLVALVLIYLLLVIGSNVFQQFVVYGRLVKVMVPMFCVITAYVLSDTRWQCLAILFLLLLPGFIFNTWQVQKVPLWADVLKQERILRKTLPDNSEMILKYTCVPHLELCGNPVDERCSIIRSFLLPENLKFYQYDSVDSQLRELSEESRLYINIVSCPVQSRHN